MTWGKFMYSVTEMCAYRWKDKHIHMLAKTYIVLRSFE